MIILVLLVGFQQIKRNPVVSAISNLCKCRVGRTKQNSDRKTSKTTTMETRFTDEQSMTTGTTIIECINDTRFSSIRETRQLKDQTGNFQSTASQFNKSTRTKRIAVLFSFSQLTQLSFKLRIAQIKSKYLPLLIHWCNIQTN